MVWRIEFERNAERELSKLDNRSAKRILKFLHDRVAGLENPRVLGEALKGSRFAGLWKYRVGDYRIIVEIEDQLLRILVVRIGTVVRYIDAEANKLGDQPHASCSSLNLTSTAPSAT